MNLIDAIKLYCHIMQQTGGGLEGRRAAKDALLHRDVGEIICSVISETVSNDGHLVSGNGAVFAMTQISAS